MTETEFLERAEGVLDELEDLLDNVSDDLELDLDASRHGNVLHIETGSGEKLVVNLQTPMQEIWIAARAGGFHYHWDGDQWRDTRDGTELHAALSRLLTAATGVTVQFAP